MPGETIYLVVRHFAHTPQLVRSRFTHVLGAFRNLQAAEQMSKELDKNEKLQTAAVALGSRLQHSIVPISLQ